MSFADASTFSPRPQAPRLAAGDVVLRHHTLGDFDPFWAFYQSPQARHVDAPKSATHLWYGLASEIASWQLVGIGGWAIEEGGALAGQIAIIQPPHFPEVELGWILFDGFEGRSIAYRAAGLARDWFFEATSHPSLVSYIDRNNTRSQRLAERLGAQIDPEAARYDEVDVVYRHRRPA